MLDLAKLMISDMHNVLKTSGIFYMGAYLPEHWIVADGKPFYCAEWLMADYKTPYEESGFLSVHLRDAKTSERLGTGKQYFKQVLICFLLMCANLCETNFAT